VVFSVPDEGYSSIVVFSVPDEGYSSIVTSIKRDGVKLLLWTQPSVLGEFIFSIWY
jgi:hypothetical protein